MCEFFPLIETDGVSGAGGLDLFSTCWLAITKIFARPNFWVILHVRQQKIYTKYTAL